jgi:hypothetical protein
MSNFKKLLNENFDSEFWSKERKALEKYGISPEQYAKDEDRPTEKEIKSAYDFFSKNGTIKRRNN